MGGVKRLSTLGDSLDAVLVTLDRGYRDELPVTDGDILKGTMRIEDEIAHYE